MKSHLYRRSIFFIDVFNIILHIDLFLFYEIKKRMETDKSVKVYFTKMPNIECNHQNDTLIIKACSNKEHQIILEDWIDKDLFLKYNTEETYVNYILDLFQDMLTNPLVNEFIQFTEFGNALKLIGNDDNTSKIILYMPFKSEFVESNLIGLFGGFGLDKITMYIGKKDLGSNMFNADMYVFENVQDIDNFLRSNHEIITEVIIPTYEYNLIENRDNEEKMYEQVTNYRLKLEEPEIDYRRKYNLSINTIHVPV